MPDLVEVRHPCIDRPLVYPRATFGALADERGILRLRCFKCGERIAVQIKEPGR
tara:strand:- start:3589 stop:3750 length:162 start_codon:yes stop_codon:yes gene_type:complete